MRNEDDEGVAGHDVDGERRKKKVKPQSFSNNCDSLGRDTRKSREKEQAESVSVAAFVFITREQERLERFLTLSGLAPDTLRAASQQEGFWRGVLDYLVQDEALVLSFAEEERFPVEAVLSARRTLSGKEGEESGDF